MNPSARPTVREILGHAWFSKVMPPAHPIGAMRTVAEDEGYFSGIMANGSAAHAQQQESSPVTDEEIAEAGRAGRDEGRISPRPPRLSGEGSHDTDDSESTGASIHEELPRSSSTGAELDRRLGKKLPTPPVSPMLPPIPRFDSASHAPLSSSMFASHSSLGGGGGGGGGGGAALIGQQLRNDSQTTLRKQGSASSDASAGTFAPSASSGMMIRKATDGLGASSLLPTHEEGDVSALSLEEQIESQTFAPAGQAPSAADPAQSSETAPKRSLSQGSGKGLMTAASSTGHHRTPSRSKRRSASSVVLADHHAPYLDSKPVNYVALLSALQPSLFSTTTEQTLLSSLSLLGLDVGQIVHSVMNDACDSSGALWWLLKKKADEKQALLGQLPAESGFLPVEEELEEPGPSTQKQRQTEDAPAVTLAQAGLEPAASAAVAPELVTAVPDPPVLSVPRPSAAKRAQTAESGLLGRSTGSSTPSDLSTQAAAAPRPPASPPSANRTRTSSFSMRHLANVLSGVGGSKEQLPLIPDAGKGTVRSSPDLDSVARSRHEAADAVGAIAGLGGSSSVPHDTDAKQARPDLVPSASLQSLSSVSSSMAPSSQSTKSGRSRSRFMATVRTWLGSDARGVEVDELGTQKRQKKKKPRAAAAALVAPQMGVTRSRTGSHQGSTIRVRQSGVPHSPLHVTVSRMNSSSSIYTRPPNVRNPSSSTTITPGDPLGMHAKQASRASSIRSATRHSRLTRRMGSTSSIGSHGAPVHDIDAPLRLRRRSSSDGGTVVLRERVLVAGVGSRHSSKVFDARTPTSAAGGHGDGSTRPSVDLVDTDSVRAIPAASPSPYTTQFVAHKNRMPTRGPMHRGSGRLQPGSSNSGTAPRPPATWMRSWGKPPPHWTGDVSDEPSRSEMLAALRPKLRDVFAQMEDDGWEDEDEETGYAGGLGQPGSTKMAQLAGWTASSRNRNDSPYSSRILATNSNDNDPSTPLPHVTSFRPPSLGSDLRPKVISTGPPSIDGMPASSDGTSNNPTTLAALTTHGRVRGAAAHAAFQDTPIEEEEEED